MPENENNTGAYTIVGSVILSLAVVLTGDCIGDKIRSLGSDIHSLQKTLDEKMYSVDANLKKPFECSIKPGNLQGEQRIYCEPSKERY